MYWRAWLDSWDRRDEHGDVVVDETVCADFLVESGSDSRFVAFVESRGFGNQVPDSVAKLKPRLLLHDRSRDIKVSEGVFGIGQYVSVLGVGHWELDPDPRAHKDYRSSPQRLHIAPTSEQKVTVAAARPGK